MSQLFYIVIKIFRRFFNLSLAFQRWRDPSMCPPPDLKKAYIRGYPTLIYFPSSYKPEKGLKAAYPVLINIHGGAFCMGDPELDSLVCKRLANEANCIVVNVHYRKAPEYPFPAGLDDIDNTIIAVLDDPDLPMIDGRRVALMGSSAGGALALGAALNPALQKRGNVKGIVPVMSVMDCTLTQKQRMDSLPAESQGKDVLKDIHMLIDAYMRGGDYRHDPRASPAFADPNLWPSKLMFVTARMDCLYGEQERLVKRIREVRGTDESVTWKVLDGLGHPSRDARDGVAAEKWKEAWDEVVAYLNDVLQV